MELPVADARRARLRHAGGGRDPGPRRPGCRRQRPLEPPVRLAALHLDRRRHHRGSEEHPGRPGHRHAETVKLGLITPVVTLNPRVHNAWERDAGFDAVVAIAETAERLGYSHITCSEHVAVPTEAGERRGGRYWDPLAVFGYLAARTARPRVATHVLVLAYHPPLEIAKRYGTLDQVSDGRLILGVGVGSLVEEFDLLGAPFADRGERGDDALRALRASLSTREPEYHGPYYDYE